MLEHLFKFPIAMVDGNREEEKERQGQILAIETDPPDVIMGEAECPYYDFISVADRWLPSDKSFNRALDGKFDACSVIFQNSGTFVVPWSRAKFKEELTKFAESVKKEEKDETMKVLKISREDFMRNLGATLQLSASPKTEENDGEDTGNDPE